MTAYTILLATTARAAADSAMLCYRKGRRDCYRIHALATHPRTVEAAKVAVWCLYLGAVIAFTLGQTARILVNTGGNALKRWADAQVAAALVEPAPIVDDLPALAELLEEAAIATAHPVPVMAQAMAAPVAVCRVDAAAKPKTPSSVELRRMCQERGIRWRNAHGTRHLSKAEMIAALA